MKASELIYRLARAIEENSDCNVNMCIATDNGDIECEIKCLDIINFSGPDNKTFEVYGEEQ